MSTRRSCTADNERQRRSGAQCAAEERTSLGERVVVQARVEPGGVVRHDVAILQSRGPRRSVQLACASQPTWEGLGAPGPSL